MTGIPETLSSLARLRARWPRRTRAERVTRPAGAWWPLPVAPAGTFVGGATVLGVDQVGRPVVRLHDGLASETTAEWALPWRYVPAPQDELLVIGRPGRCWVIGVARGAGRSELALRAGFALVARGTLRLQADRGVRLIGRLLTLRAARLEVAVQALQERLGSATRLVQGLLEERAGSVLRVTEGEEAVVARQVTVLSEESTRWDGDPVQVS